MNATITFVTSPAGLAPLTRFSLSLIDETSGLLALRSQETEGLRLFVVDATRLADYRPELSDEQCQLLELRTPEDAAVYAVITPAGAASTVNLLAPIVVNSRTGRAGQFILDGSAWPVSLALTQALAPRALAHQ